MSEKEIDEQVKRLKAEVDSLFDMIFSILSGRMLRQAEGFRHIQEALALKDPDGSIGQLVNHAKETEQSRRRHREAIVLLLKEFDCWTNGEADYAAIARAFDIPSTLAARIAQLVNGKAQAQLKV